MQLINEFLVPLPPDKAWLLLTDVEKIAPCMPGVTLTSRDGDVFSGSIKIKVGPITPIFHGKAEFVERDVVIYMAKLKASGRDTKGQGEANAVITATLDAAGDGSLVTILTELRITGRMASFGRGVITDISNQLFEKFLECVENELLGGG